MSQEPPGTLTLTDTQQVKLMITPTDRAGQPAPLDGIPQWSSSDTNLLTLAPNDDGLSCYLVTTGRVGQVQVTVTCDAQLGEGVTPLTGVMNVNIIAGQAVGLAISADAPQERAI